MALRPFPGPQAWCRFPDDKACVYPLPLGAWLLLDMLFENKVPCGLFTLTLFTFFPPPFRQCLFANYPFEGTVLKSNPFLSLVPRFLGLVDAFFFF